MLVPPAPANADTILKIDRIAYFSNSSQLWSVEIGWSESKTEQQKADFDNILQTFKIMNSTLKVISDKETMTRNP